MSNPLLCPVSKPLTAWCSWCPRGPLAWPPSTGRALGPTPSPPRRPPTSSPPSVRQPSSSSPFLALSLCACWVQGWREHSTLVWDPCLVEFFGFFLCSCFFYFMYIAVFCSFVLSFCHSFINSSLHPIIRSLWALNLSFRCAHCLGLLSCLCVLFS